MKYEMIFSNDGSTDGCDAVARSMMPSYPALKVIGESTNHGKGYALKTAFKYCIENFNKDDTIITIPKPI